MKGFWKIPLYTDSACTQRYKKDLIVGSYNLQEYVNEYENKTYVMNNSSGNPTTFRCGVNPNGRRFLMPDTLTCPSNTFGSFNYNQCVGWRDWIRAKLTALVTPNAGNFAASVKDKYNLAWLVDIGETVYIKNGGRIECIEFINTNNVPFKRLIFHSSHTGSDSVVKYLDFQLYPNPFINAGMNLSNFSQACNNALDGGSGYQGGCAAYAVLAIADNGQIISNVFDVWVFGTIVTSYLKNSAIPNGSYFFVTKTNYSPSTGLLYNILGNRAGNIQTIQPDSDYVESATDEDNTYPGGGNDKNSYPDDGSEDPSGESGKGDFDNTNDPIDFPTLPTFDVQSTGFISLWRPTIVQLTNLYAFLWDSDISTTLKKLFNEPMNAIFSLGIVPVDPVIQGTRNLTIGHVDTEIEMESIQKQFVTFDFGSIDINEYYGAAWDYSPYTQASIFLPYIGIQPVDIDDIMNCTLTLRYNIDILTGTTIALLKCVRKGRDNLNAVMYEWQGNCVTQCPITAGNWSQIMASVIQLGAMTGLALSQPVAGAIGNTAGSFGGTAGTKLAASASEYADGKNLVSPSMATFGALNVLGSKVHVQRGGRIDMSAGAMSMQKAFVILNRPISGIPRGWNKYAGYPSLKIKTLGSQKGFVSVGAIKLDGLRATANEIGELDAILKAGVII